MGKKKNHIAEEPRPRGPDLGIPADRLEAITQGLARVLADTYTLYLKTHNYHWNVTGPHFHTLHAMFEEQYTELWAAVDEIAERMRALGAFAPGSHSEFQRLARVKDANGVPEAMAMVAELAEDQATVVRTAREMLQLAEAAHDQPTADLMTRRIQVHEKTAWMLRALLA
ncbi:MAG: DNA starvation/stationary phase protection protein [Sphingomonadaceae bacterium]|uniref:Dps family protein n=1 Tax=Thermaurantiacus sp. TaxID=2820283 RepID=UPI00298EDDCD|nr:Dps family protein [Thermaurantiacus sp.]MCS6986107.1 DNA starvation/stationary phase protection protein [Sphingomonadaceae bacterium]MDW8414677.1 Dps family protein [Thermaurantiacus sp.]